MVEHRPRDGGVTVGEAELAEATGRGEAEAAQIFDLELDERSLVALGRELPGLEGVEQGRRDVAIEPALLARVVFEEPVPIEVRPLVGVHEPRRGGYGLCTELGDEARQPRHCPKRRREVVHLTVVPAEVEVRVRPAAAHAREDAGVEIDESSAVRLADGMRDRPVEHVLVPRRQEHARSHSRAGARRDRFTRLELDGERFVVRTPHRDARVMAEQIHHLSSLSSGLLARAAAVTPLQREVLPEHQSGCVGRVVELGPRDVGVHPEKVKVGVDRELDVARQHFRCCFGERHPSWALVRAHREDRLAVDDPVPVVDGDVTERRRESAVVAADSINLDPYLNADAGLGSVAPRPPSGRLVDEQWKGNGRAALGEVDVGDVFGQHGAGLVGDTRDQCHRRPRCNARRGRDLAGIERDVQLQGAASGGGFGAEHPQPGDPDRPRVADSHRPPDATRIPVWVEVVPVGEHPGNGALRTAVGLSW